MEDDRDPRPVNRYIPRRGIRRASAGPGPDLQPDADRTKGISVDQTLRSVARPFSTGWMSEEAVRRQRDQCWWAPWGKFSKRPGRHESDKVNAMPFATTGRCGGDRSQPERPFAVEFWDGAQLPASDGGGPTFYVRSPRAAAHVLRAPGQLGLGRAYVSGEIEVDDMDAVIEVLDSWKPPSLQRGGKARLLLAAVRSRRADPAAARPLRAVLSVAATARARRPCRATIRVSNEFFALFLDDSDLQLRLLRRGARRWRRRRRRSWRPSLPKRR